MSGPHKPAGWGFGYSFSSNNLVREDIFLDNRKAQRGSKAELGRLITARAAILEPAGRLITKLAQTQLFLRLTACISSSSRGFALYRCTAAMAISTAWTLRSCCDTNILFRQLRNNIFFVFFESTRCTSTSTSSNKIKLWRRLLSVTRTYTRLA